ncbi:MAG: response regulator transcription factor [Clostridia bacterium]|nr:response regulator transcription factor [Clostridia bacterium]
MGILIDLLDQKINTEEKKDPDTFKNIIFLQKKLSPREIDIVKLITEGLSNKEIASELNISDKTVKTHVSNILRKLEMKDRTQIIIFCQQIN